MVARRGIAPRGSPVTGLLSLALVALLTGCTSEAQYVPEAYTQARGAFEPARLVVLGDSISDTAVPELLDEVDYPNHAELLVDNDDERFPDWAGRDLLTRFPDLEVHYLAVGGAQSPDVAGEQLDSVSAALGDSVDGPTLVVITVAGNDLYSATPLPWVGSGVGGMVRRHLREVVDYFEDPARFPDGSQVYAANMYLPSGPGGGQACYSQLQIDLAPGEVAALNRRMVEGAKARDYAVLDMYGTFEPYGFGAADPEELDPLLDEPEHAFTDCLHPNAWGHGLLRELFWAAITGE